MSVQEKSMWNCLNHGFCFPRFENFTRTYCSKSRRFWELQKLDCYKYIFSRIFTSSVWYFPSNAPPPTLPSTHNAINWILILIENITHANSTSFWEIILYLSLRDIQANPLGVLHLYPWRNENRQQYQRVPSDGHSQFVLPLLKREERTVLKWQKG